MPRRRFARSTTPAARWLTGVLVAVLAVAVVLLSVLAITRTNGGDAGSTEPPRTPRPTSTTTAPATPSPSPTTATGPGPAERFLAISGDALWRSTAGDCGVTSPVLERSTDGGATWTNVTPTYLGVRQILALDPFANGQAQIVALVGASCEPQALRTFTQGQFWASYPEVLAASTYVSPTDAATVVTPTGTVAAPCAQPWGLRSSQDVVGLVCDGTAYERTAESWRALATDAIALTIADHAVVYATTADADFPAAVAVSGGTALIWSDDRVTDWGE